MTKNDETREYLIKLLLLKEGSLKNELSMIGSLDFFIDTLEGRLTNIRRLVFEIFQLRKIIDRD